MKNKLAIAIAAIFVLALVILFFAPEVIGIPAPDASPSATATAEASETISSVDNPPVKG